VRLATKPGRLATFPEFREGQMTGIKYRSGLAVEGDTLARNIRAVRRHLGMNDKALAATLACSSGAVRNWESGADVPGEEKLQAIVKLAGPEVTMEWLLRGEGVAPTWATEFEDRERPRLRPSQPWPSSAKGAFNVAIADGRILVDCDATLYDVSVTGLDRVEIERK
jgi:DNA-binding transcriptional regulator YiaG